MCDDESKSAGFGQPAQQPKSAGLTTETVCDVTHWTDRLFSFRLSRPAGFRFRSGEFVMIGLMDESRPLLRAYSIASPHWAEALEFYSIKVPDGPLTSRLQRISVGDAVMLGRKATGTLVLDALTPGRRLFLLATGTGFAPFAAILRDPETYERFEQIVLVHTCRQAPELEYSRSIVESLVHDPLVGEAAAGRVVYCPSATREPGKRGERLTTSIQSGGLFRDFGLSPLDAGTDRIMICGSMPMTRDCKALLEAAGFTEGAVSEPGHFVVERAFVG